MLGTLMGLEATEGANDLHCGEGAPDDEAKRASTYSGRYEMNYPKEPHPALSTTGAALRVMGVVPPDRVIVDCTPSLSD